MDFSGIIGRLDAEWDTNGFFGRFRNGSFDAGQAQDILDVLRGKKTDDEVSLPKRLVTVLW